VIDFRYHLVSIVAVFLALAIGIVLGSTELQGHTLDALRSFSDSQKSQLQAASEQRNSYARLSGASDTFVKTAEPKLLDGMLAGERLVIVTEPGAPSAVVNGVKQAAGLAGATVTGTVALEPKFNDLSGTTQASLNVINAQMAASDVTPLTTTNGSAAVYQQQAAQLIATAILAKKQTDPGLPVLKAKLLLDAYASANYLAVSGALTDQSTLANRATVAVLVTPGTAPADGANDPANQVLLGVAQEFAAASAATVVSGSIAGSAPAGSAVAVLRGSSVSGQVSTVDNADTTLGQISTMWALAGQQAGGKPNSYGISGASAVSPPVPLPVPSATPTPPVTPSGKATGKVKKTVTPQ
jgi:hypothetical protein